jgi:hypothetical protein
MIHFVVINEPAISSVSSSFEDAVNSTLTEQPKSIILTATTIGTTRYQRQHANSISTRIIPRADSIFTALIFSGDKCTSQ